MHHVGAGWRGAQNGCIRTGRARWTMPPPPQRPTTGCKLCAPKFLRRTGAKIHGDRRVRCAVGPSAVGTLQEGRGNFSELPILSVPGRRHLITSRGGYIWRPDVRPLTPRAVLASSKSGTVWLMRAHCAGATCTSGGAAATPLEPACSTTSSRRPPHPRPARTSLCRPSAGSTTMSSSRGS